MSLASSVVIIVAVVIELSVVGSIAGVTHRRFPTYVRTKRDLHVFRALRTRSFILRFQRFFSGDAHPSIQSWLVFAFLFRRCVRISRHRLFVVERIDVDADTKSGIVPEILGESSEIVHARDSRPSCDGIVPDTRLLLTVSPRSFSLRRAAKCVWMFAGSVPLRRGSSTRMLAAWSD